MSVEKISGERYKLYEPLGEGRFAIVYRAEDRLLDRPVAFKLMRKEHVGGNPKWREAFEIEVDLLQKMADTAAVINMLDHGETADQRPYITLELLPSGTDLLHRVTQHGGFSEAESLPIMWQLARVLELAHARGIAYRDMKLEHIFWVDGQMVLIDWNVSRQLPTDNDPMAEWKRQQGFQSDLFKLGTMFYSIVTGVDIRDRKVPTPVYSKLEERGYSLTGEGIIWPLDFIDAEISNRMKEIIRRLVHIEPEQRFQTTTELREALEKHAATVGVRLDAARQTAGRLSDSDQSASGWLNRILHSVGRD